jgi:predicted dehydrogenase
VRWVYDLDPSRSARLIQELGKGKVAASFDTILQDKQTSIISIASFDDAHYAQTLACLAAQKHVFCEKPLCRTLAEAKEIKAALLASGRHLRSNLVLRAAPLFVWLREAIRSGELGTIYAFDGDYLYGRLQKITEGWRSGVTDYSVMLGGGVHLVDLMLWLTGERPRSVTAVGNAISTQGSSFRYDDFTAATYLCDSGLVGRITANFGCVHRHQHVVRVFGTKGTFLLDDQGPRLHKSRGEHDEPIRLNFSPVPATKGELIAPFIEAILQGKTNTQDAQHELDVIGVCVAADQARGRREAIVIEYP